MWSGLTASSPPSAAPVVPGAGAAPKPAPAEQTNLAAGTAEANQEMTQGEVSEQQLRRTFQTNFFGYFFMAQAALDHLDKGAAIVNTTSVTAFRGSPHLVDYASTKGAIVAFTRSLSQQLVGDGIRVNAVAPGPIWTPLIPSTMPPDQVESFGQQVPLVLDIFTKKKDS